MSEEPEKWCERCGEKLDRKKAVELELDQDTSLYHLPGTLPEGHASQGIFFFGRACAKAVLANGGWVQTIGKRAPANRPRKRR